MQPEQTPAHRTGETILDSDPRFSFAWRLPPSGAPHRPLLIAVHGSGRNWIESRDAFVALADTHDLAILAPLFPAGMTEAGGDNGYKFLREPGIEYLAVLDDMLSTFAALSPFNSQQIYLFGFSGGAQFALRFGLLNAARLRGVVIAAPGNVTLLDDTLPWWAGTANVEAALGRSIDIAALRRLPVRLLIGSDDTAKGIEHAPGTLYHSPHAGCAGENRLENIVSLARSLHAAGVPVALEMVPGAGHDFAPVAAAAAASLHQLLRSR